MSNNNNGNGEADYKSNGMDLCVILRDRDAHVIVQRLGKKFNIKLKPHFFLKLPFCISDEILVSFILCVLSHYDRPFCEGSV